MTTLALPAQAQITYADEPTLADIYRRGTPPNTLRAWERDLSYISAWKMAAFVKPLALPQSPISSNAHQDVKPQGTDWLIASCASSGMLRQQVSWSPSLHLELCPSPVAGFFAQLRGDQQLTDKLLMKQRHVIAYGIATSEFARAVLKEMLVSGEISLNANPRVELHEARSLARPGRPERLLIRYCITISADMDPP